MENYKSFACPHCGSENTVSVPLAYKRGHATGTAVHREVVGYNVETTTTTYGDGHSESKETGRTPVYGNVTHGTYTQTDLAAEIAPPKVPKEPKEEQNGCFFGGLNLLASAGMAFEPAREIAYMFSLGKEFKTAPLAVLEWGLIVWILYKIIDKAWHVLSGKGVRFARAKERYKEELAKYQSAYEIWSQRYICMRCGHQYYLD